MSKGRDALAIAITALTCVAVVLLELDPVLWAPLLAMGVVWDVRGMLAEGGLRDQGGRFVLGIAIVLAIATMVIVMLGGWVGTRAIVEIAIVCAMSMVLLEFCIIPLLRRLPDGTV